MTDSAIQTHLPDGWREDRLLFYIKPFLTKWRKTFPDCRLGVVCQSPIQAGLWQKALKVKTICHIRPEDIGQTPNPNWDGVVVIDPDLTIDTLKATCQLITPYGMVLGITRNQTPVWPQWQDTLEQGILDRLYTIGINPYRSGAAWWPFAGGQPVSHVMDFLQSIVPGRTETNRKWGRAWLIQGYRPYTQTVLTAGEPQTVC